MEKIDSFLGEDWESLSRAFTFEEDQLNDWSFENLSNSWPIFNEMTNLNGSESGFNSSDPFLYHVDTFSQESGNDSSSFSSHSQSSESNNTVDAIVFSTSEDKRNTTLDTCFLDDYMGEMFTVNEDILIDVLGNKNGQLKRKLTMPSLINYSQNMSNTESFSMTSKKRPRVSVSTIAKTDKKRTSNSSAYNGDSDNGSSNKVGKKGIANGGATDSQSVYARKRREKINERLKTLQKLVPNGTKVDISTMLDEAVHYVKFLQLQIKLLSCDDKWMYSPIAYNGMDSGLHSL